MNKPTVKDIATTVVVMSKSSSQQKIANGLAAYLIKERRSGELDAVMREVKRLREKNDGIVEADTISAFPVSDQTIGRIMNLLGADKYVVNKMQDKTVVGGVRVEASGKQLDLTVRNRLEMLKKGATA